MALQVSHNHLHKFMKRILIGVPTIRKFEPFWESLSTFVSNSEEFYKIYLKIVEGKRLGTAQNEIAEYFIEGGYDYLLFLDDDHWGHTVQMLDCLIKADTDVAVIKSYARHYPYISTLLRYAKEKGISIPVENGDGYEKVDIAGFPMTLISRRVFKLLEQPYFREEEFLGRDWNTDVNFCERLSKVGIRPVGCFQHCLNHDIVTKENVQELRHKGCVDANKKAMLRGFYIQQEMIKGV